MKITNSIYYIGVNDYQIDLFEGQYPVPNGISYNSYIIIDDKIAVLDTVDKNFKNQWLSNIKNIVKDRNIDYLIIHHMEPDHSSNIVEFIRIYPNAKIVASEKSFIMIKNFFHKEFINNRIIVKDYDELNLGNHKLKFFTAPMVHWPEVIMSYEINNKILFSADAFGKFGGLDIVDNWEDEARRYYFGIIGKYGQQVQSILNKLSTLEIKTICSLHGPILKNNINYYLNLYKKWSNYIPEEEGIAICYTSIYGHTKESVYFIKDLLIKKGAKKVVINDLARCDVFKAIEDGFRYNKLILATTTYNNDIFPAMKIFINGLVERNYQNRTIGIIENGSWSIVAGQKIKTMFEKSKNVKICNNTVSIFSNLNENNIIELENLSNELLNKEVNKMKYMCEVCGWTYDEELGDPENGIAPGTKFEDLPEDFVCPLCGVGKDQFVVEE